MNSRIADASNVLELAGLSELKRKAKSGDQVQEKEALREVAKQFESIFMSMMLKSMRQANDVLASDSPLNTQSTKFYRDMHDQQMAAELSNSGSLGLSDLIVRQLGGEEGYTPASVLRSDGQLSDARNSFVVNTQVSNTENVADVNVQASKSRLSSELSELKEAVYFESPEDFIDKIMPYTEQAQAKLGVPKEVIIAQAALETGWGKKIIRHPDGTSSNNLFNIKADKRWAGSYAAKETLEFQDGSMVRKKAPFRSYESLAQSVNDYIDFLSSSERYKDLINNNLSVDQFLHGLQQAGYATDPNYANKILGVFNKVAKFIK